MQHEAMSGRQNEMTVGEDFFLHAVSIGGEYLTGGAGGVIGEGGAGLGLRPSYTKLG